MSVCIKDNIQNMNLVIGCTVGCSYCYARNNVKRYHMIDDFSKPEFFPNKLRLMEKKRPQNFLLTGMSDLAGWQPEWRDKVFAKIRENPQHQFLFCQSAPTYWILRQTWKTHGLESLSQENQSCGASTHLRPISGQSTITLPLSHCLTIRAKWISPVSAGSWSGR